MIVVIVGWICLQIVFAIITIKIIDENAGSEDFWKHQCFLWTPAQFYKYSKKVNWFGAYFLAFLLLLFNTVPYLIRILWYLCCVGRKD